MTVIRPVKRWRRPLKAIRDELTRKQNLYDIAAGQS